MTDNKDDKTISVAGKKTLTLKPSGVQQGTVRQDMGRGRTKAVVVETRKRRPSRPEDERPPIQPVTPAPRVAEQALSDRKPFNEYWSLQALRRCVAGRCASLTPDLRRRLDARAEVIGRGTDRARVVDGILRDCP